MYSPRPGTVSAKIMADDVPPTEKARRLHLLDELQHTVVADINARYLGQSVQVLVEGRHKGKWRGRTRNDKLVFFEDATRDWTGRLVDVEVTWPGPWSMQARLPQPMTVEREVIPLVAG